MMQATFEFGDISRCYDASLQNKQVSHCVVLCCLGH